MPTEPATTVVDVVDPHHHMWDMRGRGMSMQELYLLPELRADAAEGGFRRTVFVECGYQYDIAAAPGYQEVGETRAIAAIGRESEASAGAVVAGIVGSCNLMLGDELPAILEAHEVAGDGRFRGIRHRLAHDPTGSTHSAPGSVGGLMARDELRAGVAELGRRGHTFDAWLYHPQLPEFIEMVDAVPGTTIVLDHIGAPIYAGAYADQVADVHAFWRDHMAGVAQRANVVVKLGGIGMASAGHGWDGRLPGASSAEIVARWSDDLVWLIDTFGADRCLFESNFPVDKVSFTAGALWTAFRTIAADRSPEEQRALFAGTAERVYRLG